MSNSMRRVLLTKRKKPTTTSSVSESTSAADAVTTTADVDSNSQVLSGKDCNSDGSPLPQRYLATTSVKRETSSPETPANIKPEAKSPSPVYQMGPAAGERNILASRSLASTAMTKPMNSLVSGMIDSTKYASASAAPKDISASNSTTKSDEQVAKKVAAAITGFPSLTANSEHQNSFQQTDNPLALDFPFDITPMRIVENGKTRQNDTTATTNGVDITPAIHNNLPKPTGVSLADSRATSFSPSTSTPQNQRSQQRSSPTPGGQHVDPSKASTSSSLYPGPSATMSSSDTSGGFVPNKRPKTGRSEHPERFLYAGNTFSNLDDRIFHQAAQNNPYLSQLTADASRPVYKSPVEARHAIRDAAKPPVVTVNHDQQIQELTVTMANFRKKYEKSKQMTARAGIEVAGNVWDRLANITQYPPDFDKYRLKREGELAKYAQDMKAWDLAIGHQVIIKKRIVYKEAIEKLQTKLEILHAEKDIDHYHTNLKRKADDPIDHESEEDD